MNTLDGASYSNLRDMRIRRRLLLGRLCSVCGGRLRRKGCHWCGL